MDVRLVAEEELDELSQLLGIAYLDDADDAIRERFRKLNERDRTFVAVDGDEIVGSVSAYSFDLTVPGGAAVPMAGTTIVAVKPTHRRQGLLRELMAAHFDDVTSRSEPLAGLWASEAAIYGRFGFGEAVTFTEVTIDSARGSDITGELDPTVSVRMIDRDAYLAIAPSLYDAVRPGLHGTISRSKQWWDLRVTMDDKGSRRGASSYRYLAAYRDGEPVGCTHYRTKDDYTDGLSAGEVRASAVLATDLGAELALWNVLLSIDLTTKVKAYMRPIDDPVLLRLNDPRKYTRKISDALYLRLHDVPTALAARTYLADGEVTIGITDQDTAGSYRLVSDSGTATAERTDDEPDVTMEARTLGSIYLGGTRGRSMARAGRVVGSDSAIDTIDAMFETTRPPVILDGF